MEEMMQAETAQPERQERPAVAAVTEAPATGLRLVVVNPADNAQFELTAVPPDTTPGEIMEQLVRDGHMPSPPDGRAYVISIRGGHDLDPAQSLGTLGVPSGATLQMFSDAPGAAVDAVHRERLQGDLIEMGRLRCALIDWSGEGGTPPSAYVVTYHLPSYIDAAFTRRDRHRVRYELVPEYPFAAPAVRMLDQPPVLHPNIFPDGRICIGTTWSPEEGLAFLAIKVAKMLLYYAHVSNPQHPANRPAAWWYAAHRSRFPVLNGVAFPDPLTGVQASSARFTTVRVTLPAVRR